jgi:hypothetical protein
MRNNIYEIDISEIASSGTFAVNTPKLVSSILRQIIIKAATSTTTFDVKIEDRKDNVVYEINTKATYILREETEVPIKDVLTLTISNASADEAFTGKLCLEEI